MWRLHATRVAPAALTVAAILIALLALTPLFTPKNNQASFGQIDARAHGVLGEPARSLDVLFVGDSEVYTSLDPLQMWRAHGFCSYDVSTSAQPLPYARTLLERALTRQAPRVVVLETNMLFRPFTVDHALWREIATRLPILEYHNRWKNLKSSDATARPKATWTDPGKGFATSDKIAPSTRVDHMRPTAERARIQVLNHLYLDAIIDMCRNRGIQVLLLSTPSTKNWSRARHNAVEHYLEQRGDTEGVAYLDLNLEPKVAIDWKRDTSDGGDHLNRTGADKVSSFMGTWLAKRYDLPDHRDEPSYRTWDAGASAKGATT